MRRFLVFVLAIATLWQSGMGCRPSTNPSETRKAPPVDALPSASKLSASSSASHAFVHPPMPYDFEYGCAGDVDGSLSLEKQLDVIGDRCASGLSPLVLLDGQVDVAAHTCIRIGIATSPSQRGLRVVLEGPGGRELDTVRVYSPVLVPREGVICVGKSGRYRVRVSEMDEGVDVAVRVWGGLGE